MTIPAFFAYARERHAIYLRRQMGLPRKDCTNDKILKTYRFCNVFRELDTTTIWLRENVRDPLRDKPEVLLAVVLFRWFNRIRTGEAIFKIKDQVEHTAWDWLIGDGDIAEVGRAVRLHCGNGPYVTGSYIIKTPDGMDKLTGVLRCVKNFMKKSHHPISKGTVQGINDWLVGAKQMLEWRDENPMRMESVWEWLREHDHLGDFMAYEIVSDLRYTALLDKAPDIMTWANPGPGAMRGLNRIHGRDLNKKLPKKEYIEEMRRLLDFSRTPVFWPRWNGSGYEYNADCATRDFDPWQVDAWPEWDMRTVEHTLCEFDKYERVRLGQGAPRQKFK